MATCSLSVFQPHVRAFPRNPRFRLPLPTAGLPIEIEELIRTDGNIFCAQALGDLCRHAQITQPIGQEAVEESRPLGRRPALDVVDHEA